MIYLDYNATSNCDPEVLDHMIPYFSGEFANPSSNHALGWSVNQALIDSKSKIADILGVEKDEIIFTSGSTEGINMILKSLFFLRDKNKNHIITTKTEHKAVLDTCYWLSNQGAFITYLDVDNQGKIDFDQLDSCITDKTFLVSIILANNETGYIQPISEIKEICLKYNVPLFSDTTQAVGKIKLEKFIPFVDYACFSAHKFYGPKGIGFVYQNKNSFNSLDAFIHGGGQQNGFRGGTLNTPLIIGAGKAFEITASNFVSDFKKMKKLRDRLESGLLIQDKVKINCYKQERLINTTNISIEYVDGDELMRSLRTKIALSNGSACNSESVNPSHVLIAMGLDTALAFSSLRISLGKNTTENEIDKAVDIISSEVQKAREKNILWKKK